MPLKSDMYAHVNGKKAVLCILDEMLMKADENTREYLYIAWNSLKEEINEAEDFILTNEDWSDDDTTNDLEIMFHQD